MSTEHTEWARDSDVCWRIMKETANITKKVFLSLSDSFCFVYLCFVNFWGGFLFSILMEIDDIFVEQQNSFEKKLTVLLGKRNRELMYLVAPFIDCH